jgi:hypothetical protein
MPNLAAALVKLRSLATARNHKRSLKSCLGIAFQSCPSIIYVVGRLMQAILRR